MPAALPSPSKTRVLTCAPVMTVSSGLSTIGSTNEVQVDIRRPFLTVMWVRPTPRMESASGSSLCGTPRSTAASIMATVTGLGSLILVTGSGPPTPWYSPGPSSKSSDRLKYGRTSR